MALTPFLEAQDSAWAAQQALSRVDNETPGNSDTPNVKEHSNLYDNFIYQYSSTFNLNKKCYIIDKQLVKSKKDTISVFKSSTEVLSSKGRIHPKDLRQTSSGDLFLIPFVLGLAAFTTIFVRYSKYLAKLFEALLYAYLVDKLIADLNVPTRRLLLLLDTLTLIGLSFLAYSSAALWNLQVNSGWGNILLFLLILGVLLAYRLYYYLFYKLVEGVVLGKSFAQKLHFDTLLALRSSGFVLFPLSLIVFYTRPPLSLYLLYTALGLLSTILIYRLIRLISLFLKNGVSFFYFILYLCALEIVPMAVIYIRLQRG